MFKKLNGQFYFWGRTISKVDDKRNRLTRESDFYLNLCKSHVHQIINEGDQIKHNVQSTHLQKNKRMQDDTWILQTITRLSKYTSTLIADIGKSLSLLAFFTISVLSFLSAVPTTTEYINSIPQFSDSKNRIGFANLYESNMVVIPVNENGPEVDTIHGTNIRFYFLDDFSGFSKKLYFGDGQHYLTPNFNSDYIDPIYLINGSAQTYNLRLIDNIPDLTPYGPVVGLMTYATQSASPISFIDNTIVNTPPFNVNGLSALKFRIQAGVSVQDVFIQNNVFSTTNNNGCTIDSDSGYYPVSIDHNIIHNTSRSFY